MDIVVVQGWVGVSFCCIFEDILAAVASEAGQDADAVAGKRGDLENTGTG